MSTPNPYLTNLADLRQLEARLDQRLELINRAEQNLRGLSDALRQQVTSAYPVLEDLKKTLPLCRLQADEAKLNTRADQIADAMTQQLHEAMETARGELAELSGPLRQQITDDVRAIVQAAKSSMQTQVEAVANEARGIEARAIEARAAKPIDPSEATGILREMADAFRAEAQQTLEGIRQSVIDQIDLMRADAKLQIDPIFAELATAKLTAESQLKAAVSAHESAMKVRVQQLTRSVDEIAAVLEERLTTRVAQMQRRAEESATSVEPLLKTRIDRALEQAETALRAGADKLQSRLDAMPGRMQQQTSDAEHHLADRLERLEQHATAMSSYLEEKLTSHVDQLIARLRLKLQREISEVTGTPQPVARNEPANEPKRPSVEVFVNPNLITPKHVAA